MKKEEAQIILVKSFLEIVEYLWVLFAIIEILIVGLLVNGWMTNMTKLQSNFMAAVHAFVLYGITRLMWIFRAAGLEHITELEKKTSVQPV